MNLIGHMNYNNNNKQIYQTKKKTKNTVARVAKELKPLL